jgi:hypothetical protein
METGLRAKLVEHDEIALSIDAECEMDSVQNTTDFHEKFCKHPERYEKAVGLYLNNLALHGFLALYHNRCAVDEAHLERTYSEG